MGNKTTHFVKFVFLMSVATLVVASAAYCQNAQDVGFLYRDGTYTTIAPPGSTGTYLVGINSAGQIIGQFGNSSGISNGFVYSAGGYTTIPTPPDASAAWFMGSQPTGISASGQIIGVYDNTHGSYGLQYTNATSTALAPPGSLHSAPVAINASGQVVGEYNTSQNTQIQSYFYSNGSFTNLVPPSANTTGANQVAAINNSGQVIGRYYSNSNPGGGQVGYLLSGSTYTTIQPPGSAETYPSAINASGQIVGTASYIAPLSSGQNAIFPNGFLYSGGKYTTIVPPQSYNIPGINLPPGQGSSFDLSINNSGTIVGDYYSGITSSGLVLDGGFTYKNGIYSRIDPAGSISVFNLMENNRGEIVGDYLDSSGQTYGFLLADNVYTLIALDGLPTTINGINDAGDIIGTTDLPEPSTWAMMILGFVGIGVMVYRRRKALLVA